MTFFGAPCEAGRDGASGMALLWQRPLSHTLTLTLSPTDKKLKHGPDPLCEPDDVYVKSSQGNARDNSSTGKIAFRIPKKQDVHRLHTQSHYEPLNLKVHSCQCVHFG